MDRGRLDREPEETWCLPAASGRNGSEGSLIILIPHPLARKLSQNKPQSPILSVA